MHISRTARPLTIALFDSGIGGLSLLNPLLNTIPARYLYFADTAFLPYGNKTLEQLQDRCSRITTFLVEQGADIIICACNTLSTCALPLLSPALPIPCISSADLIINGLKNVMCLQTIGVIGTEATIKSKYFSTNLTQHVSSIQIIERKCPLLASWIEEKRDQSALAELLAVYLHPIKQAQAEVLIIGCTHYAHVRSLIKKYMGNHTRLVSAEDYVVDAVRYYIAAAEYSVEKNVLFFNSLFEQSAERFAEYLPSLSDYQCTFMAIPPYLSLV